MTRMDFDALQRAAADAGRCAPGAPARVVTSEALLAGSRTLAIAHEGEVYTLRLTRQNKLLLTK